MLDEVRDDDRVLDMGTGSGVNGIVAASRSRDVLAVDVNPAAVACARDNAERNGVADRMEVRESDLFQNASGRFDLIIFDRRTGGSGHTTCSSEVRPTRATGH